MSNKRQATSDLNHNNWDQEEEPENAGRFREADEAELKTRVIKKAKRRIADSSAGDEEKASKSIFSGFSGFSKANPTTNAMSTTTPQPFSFLAKIPIITSTTAVTPPSSTQSTTMAVSNKPNFFTENKSITNNQTEQSQKEDEYFSKIIKLNQTFSEWIKKKIAENPLCNLIPTFKDYENYWQELKQQHQGQKNNVGPASPSTSVSSAPSFLSTFNFNANSTALLGTENSAQSKQLKTDFNVASNSNGLGLKNDQKTITHSIFADKKNENNTTANNANTMTGFSFGLKSSATAGFSFGLKKNEEPSTTGTDVVAQKNDPPKMPAFSFTPGGAPFSFGNIKPPPAVSNDGDNDADKDEDDEPPKVEIKEIVEEDATYTKKCKIFVKKDNAYKDFGLGTLYLKPVAESAKTQLLVRSSNNLGTILINVLLVEGMHTQRVGKNNVMIIHPNTEGETQTTLIRVKNDEEANELLDTVNKHKK